MWVVCFAVLPIKLRQNRMFLARSRGPFRETQRVLVKLALMTVCILEMDRKRGQTNEQKKAKAPGQPQAPHSDLFFFLIMSYFLCGLFDFDIRLFFIVFYKYYCV